MRIVLALVLAIGLLLATASTALMATVTQSLGGAGGVTCSFAYDDVSALISTFSISNQDTASHVMTVFVLNPADPTQVLASRSFTQGAQSTRNFDVSANGIHMTDRIAKDGSHYLGLPAPIGCAVS